MSARIPLPLRLSESSHQMCPIMSAFLVKQADKLISLEVWGPMDVFIIFDIICMKYFKHAMTIFCHTSLSIINLDLGF